MATKLSRSKIDLFVECPRCFWLDVKNGVKRPSFPPYTINNAVDYLLKQEFDEYRKLQEPHPIMAENGIEAVPFAHPDIDRWRHNFTGVRYEDEKSDFLVFGAVDDVWVSPDGTLFIVDYKATGANQHQIYDSYMRQMEIYQWLMRQNGFDVSPVGYFVFARVDKGKGFSGGPGTDGNDGKAAVLPFNLFLESYSGNDSWISDTLLRAKETLEGDVPPDAPETCKYCTYQRSTSEF